MKRYFTYLAFGLCLLVSLFSCDKDPSIDDNFLNYKIEKIPATKDYTLGAFYINYGNFNPAILEVPSVGKYNFTNGAPSPAVMASHIQQAAKSKINYFIFSLRSANANLTNYTQDSLLVRSFLNAPGNSDMHFALSYNLNIGSNTASGQLPISNTAPIENFPAYLEGFYKDFERMTNFFKLPNYQKVNDKPLIIITPAQNLSSKDNPALYAELRRRVKAKGFDLYIVGMQDRWSPPQRFYFRFEKCVDAMYESKMVDAGDSPDRVYLFPQLVDQNWQYWKSYLKGVNIDFIPSISPGYNYTILNPSSKNLPLGRNAGGASEDEKANFYRDFCNIAKKSAPDNGLIFIDSFNEWRVDSQIESAESYGDLYLDVTRQEFKLNP
jgi:hypothetical protein